MDGLDCGNSHLIYLHYWSSITLHLDIPFFFHMIDHLIEGTSLVGFGGIHDVSIMESGQCVLMSILMSMCFDGMQNILRVESFDIDVSMLLFLVKLTCIFLSYFT